MEKAPVLLTRDHRETLFKQGKVPGGAKKNIIDSGERSKEGEGGTESDGSLQQKQGKN